MLIPFGRRDHSVSLRTMSTHYHIFTKQKPPLLHARRHEQGGPTSEMHLVRLSTFFMSSFLGTTDRIAAGATILGTFGVSLWRKPMCGSSRRNMRPVRCSLFSSHKGPRHDIRRAPSIILVLAGRLQPKAASDGCDDPLDCQATACG